MKGHQYFSIGLFWSAGAFVAIPFNLFWLVVIAFLASIYCLVRGVWVLAGHEYRFNGGPDS